MKELSSRCKNMLVVDEKTVPWFPRHISELDRIAPRILDAGADLHADHPGFHDKVYRQRREELAQMALNHKFGDEIPFIKYTEDEVRTWGIVYNKLRSLQEAYAVPEYNAILRSMEKECGFSDTNIPQARDISKFLTKKTGFTLWPVAGLLSSR